MAVQTRKKPDQFRGIFIDVLIILILLGCILGIIFSVFAKVNTENVKNQTIFHIQYQVDRISLQAGATLEFGSEIWLDDDILLGTLQEMTLAESQIILDDGTGKYQTFAYPDDNTRSMSGKIYATGSESLNHTLLLDGTKEILPGQTFRVHSQYADFELRIISVQLG